MGGYQYDSSPRTLSGGWENNEGTQTCPQTINEKWQAGCDLLVIWPRIQHFVAARRRNESCGRSCLFRWAARGGESRKLPNNEHSSKSILQPKTSFLSDEVMLNWFCDLVDVPLWIWIESLPLSLLRLKHNNHLNLGISDKVKPKT